MGSGASGWPGEIAQNAHDEREFLEFDRVADFHVVGDVDARRADPIQFVLCALFCHLPSLYRFPGFIAMRQLQPVIWMKGTFLSPQHLQAQDRFIEDSLRFRLESLSANPWGFLTPASIRRPSRHGVFGLPEASGIFPDGLLFDFPSSDAPPAPKPLLDCFQPDQRTLDVYLAVPHARIPGLNVSMTGIGADTRYVAEAILVRDENSGLAEKPVQVARKNFRLITEGDSRQECSALRVARVRKTEAGTLQLDPQFVPPLLDISASDYLRAIARRLVEILAAKSSMLGGLRRQKNLSLADFGAADIANFWLLYTINSHFPEFQHLFETRRGHPERLFEAMLSLAGCLTTFSPKIHPRDLPVYEHDDLSRCFADLDDIGPNAARNRGAQQLRVAAVETGAALDLRHGARRR